MSDKLTALACDDSYCDHVPFKDGDLYDREEVDELVKELEQQNSALLTQIARLHSDFREIEHLHHDLFTLQDAKVIAIQAQSRTPKQSLSSLKSSVEEEVICACVDIVEDNRTSYPDAVNALWDMPRKYKEEG